MLYEIRYTKPHFADIIKKLKKKNKSLYNRLIKKIETLVVNPYSTGHELHGKLKGFWDTHINPYVLIYHIDEKRRIVRLVYFDHHDQAFKKAVIAIPSVMEDLLRF